MFHMLENIYLYMRNPSHAIYSMSFCDVFDVTDFVGLMKTPMNPICVFTMRDLSCNHLFQKYYGALVLQNIDWPLTTSKMANMEHLMHYVCCILPSTYMLPTIMDPG